jgi:hypothetical protein
VIVTAAPRPWSPRAKALPAIIPRLEPEGSSRSYQVAAAADTICRCRRRGSVRAADLLGVSDDTVRRRIDNGILPAGQDWYLQSGMTIPIGCIDDITEPQPTFEQQRAGTAYSLAIFTVGR